MLLIYREEKAQLLNSNSFQDFPKTLSFCLSPPFNIFPCPSSLHLSLPPSVSVSVCGLQTLRHTHGATQGDAQASLSTVSAAMSDQLWPFMHSFTLREAKWTLAQKVNIQTLRALKIPFVFYWDSSCARRDCAVLFVACYTSLFVFTFWMDFILY